MSDIITVIKDLEGLVSMRGVSKESVAVAEKRLGLSFATDYAAYLEQYGLISAMHIEITGLAEAKRLNVVDVTLAERQRDRLPTDMYVIEDTGIEGILILQNGNGEIFEFRGQEHLKKIYDCLAEYLVSKTEDDGA